MRLFSLLLLSLAILSCSSSKKSFQRTMVNSSAFYIAEVSTDSTYGYDSRNPVMVGGDMQDGPLNEKRYLNGLAGPNGEMISYSRSSSCCPVKSKNGFMGYAMLDHFRVTWEGSKDTVSIYLNMYDPGEIKAPVGFTLVWEQQ